MAKEDKEMINEIDYEGIRFPVSKKDYCKIERQSNICINVFCYENKLTYPVYLSNQKFKDCIDLLLISNENKSHYVYIEDFNGFMFNKTKCKNKKYFCKCCLQCFSNEQVLKEHRENCLIINGEQSVKLRGGSISFKNYFKQLPVLFKIYADFECILKKAEWNSIECDSTECNFNSSYTEKYQSHVRFSFAYTVVCIDNRFSKKVVLYRGKNAVYKFIKSILSEHNYCKRVIKKHFNKNLIMSPEEEKSN